MPKLLKHFLFFLQLGVVGSMFLFYLTVSPQRAKATEIICPDGTTKCKAEQRCEYSASTSSWSCTDMVTCPDGTTKCNATTQECKYDDTAKQWKCVAKKSFQQTELYKKGIPETFKTGDEIKKDAPKKIVEDAFKWFVTIAGILSVAGLVYGGIMYAIAGGDENRLKKAKTIVLWSLIGGVVILLAWGLVNFVVTRLSTIEGIPEPSI